MLSAQPKRFAAEKKQLAKDEKKWAAEVKRRIHSRSSWLSPEKKLAGQGEKSGDPARARQSAFSLGRRRTFGRRGVDRQAENRLNPDRASPPSACSNRSTNSVIPSSSPMIAEMGDFPPTIRNPHSRSGTP